MRDVEGYAGEASEDHLDDMCGGFGVFGRQTAEGLYRRTKRDIRVRPKLEGGKVHSPAGITASVVSTLARAILPLAPARPAGIVDCLIRILGLPGTFNVSLLSLLLSDSNGVPRPETEALGASDGVPDGRRDDGPEGRVLEGRERLPEVGDAMDSQSCDVRS